MGEGRFLEKIVADQQSLAARMDKAQAGISHLQKTMTKIAKTQQEILNRIKGMPPPCMRGMQQETHPRSPAAVTPVSSGSTTTPSPKDTPSTTMKLLAGTSRKPSRPTKLVTPPAKCAVDVAPQSTPKRKKTSGDSAAAPQPPPVRGPTVFHELPTVESQIGDLSPRVKALLKAKEVLTKNKPFKEVPKRSGFAKPNCTVRANSNPHPIAEPTAKADVPLASQPVPATSPENQLCPPVPQASKPSLPPEPVTPQLEVPSTQSDRELRPMLLPTTKGPPPIKPEPDSDESRCLVCHSKETSSAWYCMGCLETMRRALLAVARGFQIAPCGHTGEYADFCSGCRLGKFMALAHYYNPKEWTELMSIIPFEFFQKYSQGPFQDDF